MKTSLDQAGAAPHGYGPAAVAFHWLTAVLVLAAFQDVEDNLAALALLEQAAAVQEEAVAAAREAAAIANNQYKAGTVSYLNVVVAQTTALANQRAAVDLLSRRVNASVQLITALGGGWTAR